MFEIIFKIYVIGCIAALCCNTLIPEEKLEMRHPLVVTIATIATTMMSWVYVVLFIIQYEKED